MSRAAGTTCFCFVCTFGGARFSNIHVTRPSKAIPYQEDIPVPSPLTSWAILVDGTIPDATFDRIRTHPGFDQMARMFMAGSLDLAAKDKRVDGIFKDMGRYGAAIWTLYLHATGGVTLPRLKDLCQKTGMFSPGRARALLIYLQMLGYVSGLPKTNPGPKQYIPNPSLVSAIKKQVRLGLRGLLFIDPGFQLALDHFDEPEFFRIFITELGRGAVGAATSVDQQAALWTVFLMRHAGSQILQLLVLKDHDVGGSPIALSVAAIARQLNVARSHVNRILRLAQEARLIDRDEAGAVILLDEVRHQARLAFTLQLTGYAVCAAIAYETVIAKTVP